MLGSIFVITPTLGWSWPVLTPVILATAAGLGFQQITSPSTSRARAGVLGRAQAKRRTVVLSLDRVLLGPVADEVGSEQRLVFEKEQIQVIFRRDARGKFHVEVTGPETFTRRQLLVHGEQFALALIQEFAHNRVVKELERRGMVIVGEELDENGDIVIRGRRLS